MLSHLRTASGLTAALIGAALLAGCGSDDDKGATAASGKPIRVMVLAEISGRGLDQPQIEAAAKAAADAVNAAGGVRGRPLQIEACDSHFDPNGAESCARRAVGDRVAAAVALSGFGDRYMPILERAGIPSIANLAESPAERTSRLSFPLTWGSLPPLVGTAALLRQAGAQRIRPVLLDAGAEVREAAALMKRALAATGTKLADPVLVPVDATDLSPSVAAATRGGVDGIALAAGPVQTSKFLVALRQSGSAAKVAAPASALPPKTLQTLGSQAGELYLSSSFRPASDDDPATRAFVRDMQASAPDAVKDDFAADAWAGVQVFARAARDCATVDAACVARALGRVPQYELGVLPPLSFVKPGPVPPAPRVVNTSVIYLRVQDGKATPIDGRFVNPLSGGR
jgi:ABC-type branched-subunit amino acid transport system substrate-binding protein